MTPLSRSNCDLCDLFMNQMSFAIVNNTICPDWYLNWGPLDLQSNTLPLCHRGCWHLVLITLVGLFNDSFAISQTAYLFNKPIINKYRPIIVPQSRPTIHKILSQPFHIAIPRLNKLEGKSKNICNINIKSGCKNSV